MLCAAETASDSVLAWSAALQSSPATLLHRTIQRRLTQAQVTPGHRARHRLFSAVDADDVSRFVKRELAAIRAADRRRYNFDFDKMQPLEGRFQWERVGGVAVDSPCENTPTDLHQPARRLELDDQEMQESQPEDITSSDCGRGGGLTCRLVSRPPRTLNQVTFRPVRPAASDLPSAEVNRSGGHLQHLTSASAARTSGCSRMSACGSSRAGSAPRPRLSCTPLRQSSIAGL